MEMKNDNYLWDGSDPPDADVERLDRVDRTANEPAPALGIKRRIGREQALSSAEEIMPTARRSARTVQRGVCIQHLEIIERRLFQPALFGDRVSHRRAVEDLAEAKRNLAGKIRNHAPHVVRDNLQVRQFVEQTRID